jgi:hypothetical protein
MSTDPLEVLGVKGVESAKNGQDAEKLNPNELLNALNSTNPDSKLSTREDISLSSTKGPDSKFAPSGVVAIIGVLCILVSIVFGVRSIEHERTDADLKSKALANYTGPSNPEALLKMFGSKGIQKGYELYQMELKDNRSKMYQFGIAGAALLFVSYFMHHAAKISSALPAASGVEKSAADRLGELQKLRDQGLISTDEYTRRRSEIINST